MGAGHMSMCPGGLEEGALEIVMAPTDLKRTLLYLDCEEPSVLHARCIDFLVASPRDVFPS